MISDLRRAAYSTSNGTMYCKAMAWFIGSELELKDGRCPVISGYKYKKSENTFYMLQYTIDRLLRLLKVYHFQSL
jgi:hypothetical protein